MKEPDGFTGAFGAREMSARDRIDAAARGINATMDRINAPRGRIDATTCRIDAIHGSHQHGRATH